MERIPSDNSYTLANDEYRYEPLVAQDAVRIVVLEPADDFQSPLRCSITQHRRALESQSPDGCNYLAVSYTWGAPDFSYKLFIRLGPCAWSCLRITASVDLLLRYLRAPYKARHFWIDAICLNQGDAIEKSQQIPLMGQIYSEARRVHIWLGDNQIEIARRALSVMRRIELEEEVRITEEEIKQLTEFFCQPWFTRRWIIQEAVFAHDAVFHCGFHALSLSRVMSALKKASGVTGPKVLGRGSRMLLSSIESLQTPKKGLLSLLWELHESECTDARDRVAAVYALVTDERPPLHYGLRNWRELYMDVASYYFNKNDFASHVVLLHLCEFGAVKSDTGNEYPPWIPDWSKRRPDLLPYVLGDKILDSCKKRASELQQLYGRWSASYVLDESAQQRWQRYWSRLSCNPTHMKFEASRQRLRVEPHPLFFFQQCGIATQVLGPSTWQNFWREILEAIELPSSPGLRRMFFRPAIDSLLTLLAQVLTKRSEAAGEPGRSWPISITQVREGLYAHRNNLNALSEDHKKFLLEISSVLRRLNLVRIQTPMGSYWAVGPPDLLVGDWLIPLMLMGPVEFVPLMLLRPIGPIEGRQLRRLHPAPKMEQRCLRFFSPGSMADVDCLHVTATLVGSASHCETLSFHSVRGHEALLQELTLRANEVARTKGLPGPIVFDII